MIFSGDDENQIWQAFLAKQTARITIIEERADSVSMAVKIGSRPPLNLRLCRDDRRLSASMTIGEAATTTILQTALTFMGWQEYPHYALSLQSGARLVLGRSCYWPSARTEVELYDLTVGLAETAALLQTALERTTTACYQ